MKDDESFEAASTVALAALSIELQSSKLKVLYHKQLLRLERRDTTHIM